MIPTLTQQRTGAVPSSSKQRPATASSSSHRRDDSKGGGGRGRSGSAGDGEDDATETSMVLAGAALGLGEGNDAWGAQAMQTMHKIVSSGALLAEREAALRQREEAIQVGARRSDHAQTSRNIPIITNNPRYLARLTHLSIHSTLLF